MQRRRKSPSNKRREKPSARDLTPQMVSRLQAKYLMLCSQAVAESDLAESLVEKPGTSKAELIAVDLVLQFLQTKHLDMTAQTLKAEAGYALDRSFGNRWIARELEVRGREKVLKGLLVLKREGKFHLGLRRRRDPDPDKPISLEVALPTSLRERRLAIKGKRASKKQEVPAESGKSPKLRRRPRKQVRSPPSPVPVEVEPIRKSEEVRKTTTAETQVDARGGDLRRSGKVIAEKRKSRDDLMLERSSKSSAGEKKSKSNSTLERSSKSSLIEKKSRTDSKLERSSKASVVEKRSKTDSRLERNSSKSSLIEKKSKTDSKLERNSSKSSLTEKKSRTDSKLERSSKASVAEKKSTTQSSIQGQRSVDSKVFARQGLACVGCQAHEQGPSTSNSRVKSDITDISTGISTEALETVPLKFEEPEQNEAAPQPESDSECSHTYTYEYETVEVPGSEGYTYSSDDGGIKKRDMTLSIPISPISPKGPFNVQTEENVFSVTVSRSRAGPERTTNPFSYVDAPEPPVDIRPKNRFIFVDCVDIPPRQDRNVKPANLDRRQELEGVESISNVKRLNTSALSSFGDGNALSSEAKGRRHRGSSEFHDEECESLTFTGIFDQLSATGDKQRGKQETPERRPAKELRRMVEVLPDKPIMRPVEMPLANHDSSSMMMSSPMMSASPGHFGGQDVAVLRVHIIEADTGRRCTSKVRIGMRGVKLIAETDPIGGTSTPKYDEMFNVMSLNRLKDRLKLALYVDNKKYGHGSIPVRQFPVMAKTEKWIELKPFGRVHISVVPDVSEMVSLMSSSTGTELMETGSLQFDESSLARADKRMRDIASASRKKKALDIESDSEPEEESTTSSSLETSSLSLEDDSDRGRDFVIGTLAIRSSSSSDDM